MDNDNNSKRVIVKSHFLKIHSSSAKRSKLICVKHSCVKHSSGTKLETLLTASQCFCPPPVLHQWFVKSYQFYFHTSHSFIQHMFIESLLCARNRCRHQEGSKEERAKVPAHVEFII